MSFFSNIVCAPTLQRLTEQEAEEERLERFAANHPPTPSIAFTLEDAKDTMDTLVARETVPEKATEQRLFQEVDDGKVKMTLAEEVTFFNKAAILKELDSLPGDSTLELDVRNTRYLDNDIIEILEDFAFKAKERNINIKLFSERGIVENPESFIEFFKLRKIDDN